MLSSVARASRLSAARLASRQISVTSSRTFAASSTRSADILQDLYLREIKAYKVPPVKAGDEEGQVQKFKSPAPPATAEDASPDVLAKELSEYEKQTVDVEGQAEEGEATEKSAIEKFFEDDIDNEEEQAQH